MLHDKRFAGTGRSRRRRLALGTVAFGAIAAAAFLAATAVPALAGGSHGKGGGNGNGSSHNSSSNSGSHGNSANAHEHVTICHATPPDTAANGYVRISPSASGVYHGHLRQHSADIIPPFVYSGQTYSLNWNATGQAIWNNGCVVPSSSTTSTSTNTTTTAGSGTAGATYSPALTIVKYERVGATGSFVRGPVSAKVGDTVFYEMVVSDTGNTSLDVTLSDPGCDSGTLSPLGTVTLQSGGSATWYCSHVLTSKNVPTFVNVATAQGKSASAQASASSSVTAQSSVSAAVAAVKGANHTKTGGVKGAHKTIHHKARPSRPVVKAASYTG